MIATKNFVFIHMHKTGGQFILQSLAEYFPDAEYIGYHYPASLIPEKYRHLPVLGFIRNPWDWYVSWYCFLQRQEEGIEPIFDILSSNKKFGFKETVTNLINLGADNKNSRVFRDRLIEVLPETNKPDKAFGYGLIKKDIENLQGEESGHLTWLFKRMFAAADNVIFGKMENLRSDLMRILTDMGTRITPGMKNAILNSPRINTSRHYHYSSFYDARFKEYIATKDKYIIDRFGYEFQKPV